MRHILAAVAVVVLLAFGLGCAVAAGRELPGETGFTLLGAPPGAQVMLDDQPIGETPLKAPIAASVGEHRVRISKLGFAPYSETFRVYHGRVVSLLVEMVPIAGVLRLRTGAERARVFIDGRFAGDTPLEVELLTGTHNVRISRSGFQDEDLSVIAAPGSVIERDVELVELPAHTTLKRQISGGPRRWYNRWWVWTLGALGAGAVATAIIVPTLYVSRDACQQLTVEFCVPVHSAGDTRMLTVAVPF